MPRNGWTVLALGGAAVLGIAAFQVPIGTAMLRAAVDARAGRDVTQGLPDGLTVALAGTGSPLPDPTRAGPSTVVIAGRQIFVVDAGEGSARHITLMRIPNGRIAALFLTHFHSDHIDGLGPMLLLRWTSAANLSPLPVYGPPGVDRVVAGFDAAYALDAGYRTAHHGAAVAPPTGAGGTAMPFALPPKGQPGSVVVFERDGVRVTAFRVDHGPVDPAVGYRFDYKGRSVVLSGDMRENAALVTAAKGAELLVHEGLQPKLVGLLHDALGAPAAVGPRQGDARYPRLSHVARGGGARSRSGGHRPPRLQPYHPAGSGADHVSGVPWRCSPFLSRPITVGEDGMVFSLPAGSRAIGFTRWPVEWRRVAEIKFSRSLNPGWLRRFVRHRCQPPGFAR